jgi:hypothetical protein
MIASERQRLANGAGVHPEDLTPQVLREYAEELDDAGWGGFSEYVAAVADAEEEDDVYRDYCEAFRLPAPSKPPPQPRYFVDEEEERDYAEWARYSGIQPEAAEEPSELDRLLADPDSQACLGFLQEGRGGLDALGRCYAPGDDVSDSPEDALYAAWRSRFG